MSDKLIVMSKPNIPPLLAKPPRKLRTMRTGGLKLVNERPNNWIYSGLNCNGDHLFVEWAAIETGHDTQSSTHIIKSPYQVGDRLLVAEGYQITDKSIVSPMIRGKYLADGHEFFGNITNHEWSLFNKRKFPYRPTSGRFMYKSLARIIIPEVTAVTVQRPQDLSYEDIRAEGVHVLGNIARHEMFWKLLYVSIYGEDAWYANLWHFVYHWQKAEV
jgi:hypothetical protein